MMLLYSLCLLAALLLASPYWLVGMVWSGRYREGLGQRLGAVPNALRGFVQGRPVLWLHAVSVGEVLAASRLIELLDSSMPVVISTTTRTGQKLARERFDTAVAAGTTRVFYYPLDLAWIVRRYLGALRPRMLVLMESELWPRMLVEAGRAGIPVVVVNGRVSDRSLPRYRALRRLWQPILRNVTQVMAQSEYDAERFPLIGVPAEAVEAAGNLKYDVRAASGLSITRELRAQLPTGAKVIVAGSTVEGEEALLLEAFCKLRTHVPELILILAPRHPERFRAVEEMVKAADFSCIRRSDWMPHPIPSGTVFLLDSMGELGEIYSLASVAFVGGSLVPAGGHNPLEPAQFGVAIATGPYMENFRGIVAMLLEQEAIRVTPPERIVAVLGELLNDTGGMGLRARKVFDANAGASARCFAAIQTLLAENSAAAETYGGE